LAIGFYAKNIGGYFFDQVHLNWEWLAAIGFVLQASSNFFISFLSDRSNRKGWQKIFINQRYLAEYLRSALYFMPFSIPIKDQSFDLYDRDYQSTIPVFHKVRNIIRNGGIDSIQYGAYDYKTLFFDYFNRLLTSQIEYHENNAKKYKTIFNKLNKTGWFFFWLGFMIVIARALLQVIIQNVDLNQWIGSKTIWINSVESIIQGQTFLISFANMLAMMIPAIAALFFGINAITGFKNLFVTSEDVLLKLYRIQKIATFEETRKQTSFEDMSLLATQLMQVLFDETNDWHSFFSTKSINKN
jgi:hypothetical protein